MFSSIPIVTDLQTVLSPNQLFYLFCLLHALKIQFFRGAGLTTVHYVKKSEQIRSEQIRTEQNRTFFNGYLTVDKKLFNRTVIQHFLTEQN